MTLEKSIEMFFNTVETDGYYIVMEAILSTKKQAFTAGYAASEADTEDLQSTCREQAAKISQLTNELAGAEKDTAELRSSLTSQFKYSDELINELKEKKEIIEKLQKAMTASFPLPDMLQLINGGSLSGNLFLIKDYVNETRQMLKDFIVKTEAQLKPKFKTTVFPCIDWSKVPNQYCFIFMIPGGIWLMSTNKPIIKTSQDGSQTWTNPDGLCSPLNDAAIHNIYSQSMLPSWQDSLIERPE